MGDYSLREEMIRFEQELNHTKSQTDVLSFNNPDIVAEQFLRKNSQQSLPELNSSTQHIPNPAQQPALFTQFVPPQLKNKSINMPLGLIGGPTNYTNINKSNLYGQQNMYQSDQSYQNQPPYSSQFSYQPQIVAFQPPQYFNPSVGFMPHPQNPAPYEPFMPRHHIPLIQHPHLVSQNLQQQQVEQPKPNAPKIIVEAPSVKYSVETPPDKALQSHNDFRDKNNPLAYSLVQKKKPENSTPISFTQSLADTLINNAMIKATSITSIHPGIHKPSHLNNFSANKEASSFINTYKPLIVQTPSLGDIGTVNTSSAGPLKNDEKLSTTGVDNKKKKKKKKKVDGKKDGQRNSLRSQIGHSYTSKHKIIVRYEEGSCWMDPSLLDWDPNDYRIFCGDLGNEVTDEVLARAFNRYPSFQRAKVIRDKRNMKTKGFGFVSFKDALDYAKAMKEMNGKYVGGRPIKLRKSVWKDRSLDVVKKRIKDKQKLVNQIKAL